MSLIAWYKLDGDAVNSVSGNSGTVNTIGYGDGKIGKCGIGDGIAVNGKYILGEICNVVGNFTLSAWSKKNGVSVDAYGGIAGTYMDSTKKGFGLFFGDAIGNNTFYVDTGNGVRTYYPVTTPTLITYWNHYSIVYNNGWVSSYFNGILLDTRQLTIVCDPAASLCIGRWSQTFNDYYLNGNVDDVRVYDHALSAKEVKELSKAKVLHYKFDTFQEPTTNIVPTTTIVPYGLYHTLTKTGNNISMTLVSDPVYMTMQGILNLQGKVLAFSGYMKKNGVPFIFNGASISTYHQASGSIYTDPTSGYFEVTQYYDQTAAWFIHCPISAVTGDIITIDNFQIEEKYHVTPYTSLSRAGSIRDLSEFNHDAALVENVAPAWEYDSTLKKGIYKFYKDYGRDYIDIASTDTLSLSLKRQATISFRFKINLFSGNNYTQLLGKNDGTSAKTFGIWFYNVDHCITSGTTDTNGLQESFGSTIDSIALSTWYMYTLVIDRDAGIMKSYINASLVNNINITNIDTTTNSYPISIGDGSSVYSVTIADISDVRLYSTALNQNDITEIYNNVASIDDSGDLFVKNLVETNHTPLLLDYTSWQAGQTGSVGVFSQNGGSSENRRLLGRDPWNKETVLWESGSDIGSDADGGWDGNTWYSIDNTKTYRFSCWIKRSVVGNGATYMGFWSDVTAIDIVTLLGDTNPYFIATGIGITDWILLVGHLRPVGYTGGFHPDSGGYKIDGTKVVNSYKEYAMGAGTSGVTHRAYLYYSTDLATRQQFVYPRIDLCDGNEPTLVELLNGHDSRNVDLIRSIGPTNPINLHAGPTTHVNTLSEIGPTESLLAYYPLDGNILDYSGNKYHGVINSGGATVAQGLNNKKCYDFDGVNDTIRGSDIKSFINPVTNTWSSWCYPHTHLNTYNMIYGNYLPYMGMMSSGIFRFSANISGSQQVIDTGAYVDLAWYHLVFSYNGIVMKAYVNGTLVSTLSWPGTMIITQPGSTFSIGHWWNDDVQPFFFDGKIQDVRIYNKALTDEEVMILYHVTNPVTTKLKINKRRVYLGGKIKETL